MKKSTFLKKISLLSVATFCLVSNAFAKDEKSVTTFHEHPNAPAPHGVTPTEHQIQWQRLEYYAFVHFGLNTFTGREWGFGDENPQIFNPTLFDANTIVKTFKEAGFTGLIYTAKHHDGFCAWPTKSTEHNITKSPWENGKGDVVKEFAEACKKANLKFGTYLSPWDRNHAEYGREGYIKSYYQQIEELLTNYGPIFEIWFDGARGGDGFYGGSRDSRDIGNAETYYNFAQIVKNIRKLQPQTIIWGAGTHGDARWGGSEKGHVNYPHWPTLSTKGGSQNEGTGVRGGDRWVPAEGDTPINHAGWFWHENQASRVKSPQHLLQVWFDCVGRGANLILNVAPDKTGRLDSADVKSLLEFKKLRDKLYKRDFALGAKTKSAQTRNGNEKFFGAKNLVDNNQDSYWAVNDENLTPSVELKLREKATFDVVRVREYIRLGQRVDAWAVDAKINGSWQEILSGSSIGQQAMLKLKEAVTTDEIRLRITAASATPIIAELSLFKSPEFIENPKISSNNTGEITITADNNAAIFYTTDGKEPNKNSKKYEQKIRLENGGVIKAVAVIDGKISEISSKSFGLNRSNWRVEKADGKNPNAAFDNDPRSHWLANKNRQSLTINLDEKVQFSGFSYLPRQDYIQQQMTTNYTFEISNDGKKFQRISAGEFGNLKANPIEQAIYFNKKITAQYIRFTTLKSLDGSGGSVAEINLLP